MGWSVVCYCGISWSYSMCGCSNFCQGLTVNVLTTFFSYIFLALNLFYRVIYFKENYNFPRFHGGNIFQVCVCVWGGGGSYILLAGGGGPIANSYGNL